MSISLRTTPNNKVQHISLPRSLDNLLPVDVLVPPTKAHAIAVAPGHAPRRLRARIPVSCVRKAQKIALQRQNTPPSPNQEIVVNPITGRSALGPWAGPFEPLDKTSSPPSEPALPDLLYMDPQGYCHMALDDQPSKAGSHEGGLRQAARMLAGSQLLPTHIRRAHSAEVAAMQSRRGGVARPHAARRGAGAIRAAAAAINQPRKNY